MPPYLFISIAVPMHPSNRRRFLLVVAVYFLCQTIFSSILVEWVGNHAPSGILPFFRVSGHITAVLSAAGGTAICLTALGAAWAAAILVEFDLSWKALAKAGECVFLVLIGALAVQGFLALHVFDATAFSSTSTARWLEPVERWKSYRTISDFALLGLLPIALTVRLGLDEEVDVDAALAGGTGATMVLVIAFVAGQLAA